MRLKRLLRSNALLRVAVAVIAAYIRFVFATSRWRTVGGEHPEAFLRAGRPFVGAFWHGRLSMMPLAWKGERGHGLVSQNRDGELIARVLARFGIAGIRGSTRRGERDKGGGAAMRSLLRALKSGDTVFLTPDGPRGPRMRAAEGVAQVAKLSGCPMVPTTFAISRRRLMGSWDRFVLPLPFAQGVFIWGPPIHVPRDANAAQVAAARQALEDALNSITAEADRLCGQEPVAPAERPVESIRARA
jgi:lysophospholipid acyltransferase (LPLAT)-like uncharacterized protein